MLKEYRINEVSPSELKCKVLIYLDALACRMEAYQHRRLTLLNSIRLFDLHGGQLQSPVCGTLREVELPEEVEAAPEYIALSYTWGPPQDISSTPIWIDGKSLKVRKNLMSALQALRHREDDRTYWIDAICINQADVTEKNHQVASMSKIYRAAEAVKIWLGPDDESSLAALAYIRDTSKVAYSKSPSSKTAALPPVEAMLSLIQRDYWFRAWIIQEVILAHDIDIHCGPTVVAWEIFADMYLSMQTSPPDSPAIQLMLQRKVSLEDEQLLHDQTLESLIRAHHQCECEDRRDRVFALLSLASDCASAQGIQADYSISRLELMIRVLQFCQPQEPLSFVSLLFRALKNSHGDGQWKRAMEHWMQVQGEEEEEKKGESDDHLSSIRVTQFVAVSSASHDWVRQTTVDAYLNIDTREASRLVMSDFQAALAQCRAVGIASKTYSKAVHRIDSYNVVVIINPHHLAVFSVDPMKAISSPCKTLQLHDCVADCTWAACAGQGGKVVGSG